MESVKDAIALNDIEFYTTASQKIEKKTQLRRFIRDLFASEAWDNISKPLQEHILKSINILNNSSSVVFLVMSTEQLRYFIQHLETIPAVVLEGLIAESGKNISEMAFKSKSRPLIEKLYQLQPDNVISAINSYISGPHAEDGDAFEQEFYQWVILTLENPNFKEQLIQQFSDNPPNPAINIDLIPMIIEQCENSLINKEFEVLKILSHPSLQKQEKVQKCLLNVFINNSKLLETEQLQQLLALYTLWPLFSKSLIDCLKQQPQNGPRYVESCLELLSVQQISELLKYKLFRDIASSIDRKKIKNPETSALIDTIRTTKVVDSTLGLESLALFLESSMQKSSEENHRMIVALRKHYSTINTDLCMKQLKTELQQRYEQSPAKLGDIELPFDYDLFQKLNLSAVQREQALKLYYKNENHTAARYLMVPNPWLSNRASFINTRLRCADFSSFLDTIALLYTAARDDKSPPIDGFTLETRLEHFVRKIAEINRAHNWDEAHLNDKGRLEQVDDQMGDKPSCASGVMSRLLQSVMGHELSQIPTKEIINQSLIEMAREHFNTTITAENVEQIKASYLLLCENGEFDMHIPEEANMAADLKSLDIPADKIDDFIQNLKQKYQENFTPQFEQFIRNKLSFKIFQCHAQALATETSLESVLKSKLCAKEEGSGFKP